MKPLVETVRIETELPKPTGGGLRDLIKDLRSIDAYLGQINRRINGIHEPIVFKKTAKQFQSQLADAMKSSSVGLKPADISRVLGLDPKLFTDFVRQGQAQIARGMSGGSFRSVPAAAHAAFQFNKQQTELQQLLRTSVSGFFGGKVPVQATPAEVRAAGVHATLAGQIPLQILPSQIMATVGPGPISLIVPAAQITGGMPGGGSGGGGPAATKGGGSMPVDAGTLQKQANELKRVVETTKRGVNTTITNALGEFETIATTYKGGDASKKVHTQRSGIRQQLLDRIELERELLKQNLAGVSGGSKADALRGKGRVLKSSATSLNALIDEHEKAMRTLGFGPMVELMREQTKTLQAKSRAATKAAAAEDLKAMQSRLDANTKEHQANLRGEMRAKANTGRVQERAASAREKEAAAERRQILTEERAKRKYVREQAKAAALLDSERSATLKVSEGRAVLQQLLAQGYKITDTKRGTIARAGTGVRNTESYALAKDEGGHRLGRAISFEFDAKTGKAMAASLSETQRALKAVRAEAGLAGRDFFRNTLQIGAWTASVGALYGGMNLLKSGARSMVEVEYQTARLSQVFDQTRGNASALRDNLMALGAANGRTTDEALQAGIAWSRLRLSQAQTIEAVRVSLQGANVAELSVVETTEHLQGVFAAYGLKVSELAPLLGRINDISNKFNVTNAAMLEGLSRTASVARQSGVPLAELEAIIAGIVGFTGNKGAQAGNAIKSIIVGLGNPQMQKSLRDTFKIETRDNEGQMKSFSEVLREVYLSYQQLSDAERNHLLNLVAGKNQASRMAAMLDSYVVAQVKAISSQVNLNSAQEENQKITATLKSQWAGLVTEWEHFATRAAAGGPMVAMKGVTAAMRNALSLGSTPVGGAAMQGMTLLLTALSARLLVTHIQMAKVGKEGSFLANSFARAKSIGTGTATAMREMALGLYAVDMRANALSRTMASGISFLDNYGRRLVLLGRLRAGLGSSGARGYAASRGMAVGDSVLAGTAGILAGGSLRAIAGLGALMRLLGPMAAVIGGITLAVTLWNAANERLGRSSDKLEETLQKMTDRAEKFKSAAESHRLAARLFETMKSAIPNQRTEADKMRLVDQLKDAGLKEGEAKSLQIAIRMNDVLAMQVMLEKKSNEEKYKAFRARQADYIENQNIIRETERRLKELRSMATADPAHIVNLERKLDDARGKQTKLILDETEDVSSYDANRDADHAYQIRLARRSAQLQNMADIFKAFPTGSEAQKVDMEVAALEAQRKVMEARMKLMEKQDAADAGLSSQQQVEIKQMENEIATKRQQLEAIDQKMASAENNSEGVTYVPASLKERRKLLEDEIKAAEISKGKLTDGPISTESTYRKMEQKLTFKELEENAREIEALKARRKAAEMNDRATSAREFQQSWADAQGVGRDPAEKLLDKRKRLAAEQLRLEQGLAQRSTGADAELRRLEQQHQLAVTNLELSRTDLQIMQRKHQVSQEQAELMQRMQRDYQRGLLGSGPEDMLRKLAAWKMNQRGVTTGGFMAMDPRMREELMAIPGSRYNPDVRALNREETELKKHGFKGPDAYVNQQVENQRRARGNVPTVPGALVQDQMGAVARAALEFTSLLGRAGTSAAAAAEALASLPAVVERIHAAAGELGGGSGAPVLPQALGHSPGER